MNDAYKYKRSCEKLNFDTAPFVIMIKNILALIHLV